MAKQTINIGASPNDGTGTPLRTSFDYTNQNFTELYTAVGPSGNNIVVPGTATITGAATVGTTLGVTGALSAASLALSGASAGFTATASSGNSLNQISRPTNLTAGGIQFKTSSTNDWIMGLRETGDSDFHLLSYGTVADVLTVARATGNVTVSTGNVVMATSGKGIDFSATSSNGTSELLNDYEEGTWTGTITGGTFTNLTTGRYTKIGRQVFASITPNTTNITGNLVISGLPFTAGARSAMVAATAPPAGVTYSPRFVDATDIYVNVVGVYAAGSVSTYFAFTYDV